MNKKGRDDKSRLWWFLYYMLRDVYPNMIEKPIVSERHLLYMLFVLLVYIYFIYATLEWAKIVLQKKIKYLRATLRIICYPYYDQIEWCVTRALLYIIAYYYPHIIRSDAITKWAEWLKDLFLYVLHFISGLN